MFKQVIMDTSDVQSDIEKCKNRCHMYSRSNAYCFGSHKGYIYVLKWCNRYFKEKKKLIYPRCEGDAVLQKILRFRKDNVDDCEIITKEFEIIHDVKNDYWNSDITYETSHEITDLKSALTQKYIPIFNPPKTYDYDIVYKSSRDVICKYSLEPKYDPDSQYLTQKYIPIFEPTNPSLISEKDHHTCNYYPVFAPEYRKKPYFIIGDYYNDVPKFLVKYLTTSFTKNSENDFLCFKTIEQAYFHDMPKTNGTYLSYYYDGTVLSEEKYKDGHLNGAKKKLVSKWQNRVYYSI